MDKTIKGNLVDAFVGEIFPAVLTIQDSRIKSIVRVNEQLPGFILPGLIDSHVHVESSMLSPSGFAKLAVRHGSVAAVSDPHEVANVAGIEGIDFMIANGRTVPFKFFFGAPSCVPATGFESSGASIGPEQIETLMEREDIFFLSEVMNFPGVIDSDPDVLAKIEYARRINKPVDGHAPGVVGDELKSYIGAGITTDHETSDMAEAKEKIAGGMKILIREGSAAKGFDVLKNLIDSFPDSVMLCTDDIHPDDLLNGHINKLLARGSRGGVNIYNLIRAACINPVLHYKLPVGLLRVGDYADMIVVDNLMDFSVLETYIDGELVFDGFKVSFEGENTVLRRSPGRENIDPAVLRLIRKGNKVRVIKAVDGELYTRSEIVEPLVDKGYAITDIKRDILKIVVVNRYFNSPPAVGFIMGFGLKEGAIAGSISHDSHNIIAIGVNDNDIASAVNAVVEIGGGLAVVSSGKVKKMGLEIAGLMTFRDGSEVAELYRELDSLAKKMGSPLKAPFMTLSFMTLLVIPELKMSDRGLFDGKTFAYTDLFLE